MRDRRGAAGLFGERDVVGSGRGVVAERGAGRCLGCSLVQIIWWELAVVVVLLLSMLCFFYSISTFDGRFDGVDRPSFTTATEFVEEALR
jgi:hypothetical protein